MVPNDITELAGSEGIAYTYDCASQPTGVSEFSVTYADIAPEGMLTVVVCADPRVAE